MLLLVGVVVGLGMGTRMTMASLSRWSSLCLPCYRLPFVLAELQVGAPTPAPVGTVVAQLGSSNLALVVNRIPSTLVPLCGAVPPLRQHSLAQETIFRLRSAGFTARFLGSLSLVVVLLRGSGLWVVRGGDRSVGLSLLWVVVSGGAHRGMAALSRDILSTY